MRFRFVILISFSFALKSSFVVTVLIETGSRIFIILELFEVPSEEKKNGAQTFFGKVRNYM